MPDLPIAIAGMRIGLLGGSFNPPHQGHVSISLEALKRLELDCIWWLVSPQNPLKQHTKPQKLSKRLMAAQELARHPRIVVTDLEDRLGTSFSVDTITRIQARWPDTNFVWLMGADLFPQLPLWKDWTKLMRLVPIAVFDRPGYGIKALNSKPALKYAQFRWDNSDAGKLTQASLPAWSFLPMPLRYESSTKLRMNYR